MLSQTSPPLRPKTSTTLFTSVFITVFLITVMIATAITFILPESYASTCRIKVDQEVATGMNAAVSYDPYFLQTEFEVIQSQLVLEPVITQLNLNVEWGKKYFNGEILKTTETLEILKGRLSLGLVRGTKLVAITVYDDDRQEPARIANAIAEAYRDYRAKTRADLMARGIEALPPGPQRDAAQLAAQKPQPVLVKIVDQAEPGRFPVKPNKPLNIALGAVAGIVLGSVVAALVCLFQSRRR